MCLPTDKHLHINFQYSCFEPCACQRERMLAWFPMDPPPCSVPSFVPNAPVSGFSTVRFPHLGYPGKCLSARNLDQPRLYVLERTDIRPANKTKKFSICTKQRCSSLWTKQRCSSLWTKQRCSGLMFWSMNKTNLFGIWTEQRSAWLIRSIYNFICKNSGTM